MALFGSLATIASQLASAQRFAAALAYVDECLRQEAPAQRLIAGLQAGQTEHVELADGMFAMPQAYVTKSSRAEGRWESHRAYIDVQAIVAGEEEIVVSDVETLAVQEDLTPGKDVIFYAPFGGGSSLRLRAGDVAVFFPVDAHLPCLAVGAPGLVRKVVVKVPVA